MNKKVERAKKRMKEWSSKSDPCPICKKNFRYGCNHSVVQAQERLHEKYIRAIANS